MLSDTMMTLYYNDFTHAVYYTRYIIILEGLYDALGHNDDAIL